MMLPSGNTSEEIFMKRSFEREDPLSSSRLGNTDLEEADSNFEIPLEIKMRDLDSRGSSKFMPQRKPR